MAWPPSPCHGIFAPGSESRLPSLQNKHLVGPDEEMEEMMRKALLRSGTALALGVLVAAAAAERSPPQ